MSSTMDFMLWLSLTMPTLRTYCHCVEFPLSQKCRARYGLLFIYQVTTNNLKNQLSVRFLLNLILLLLIRSRSEPAKNLNMVVQPKLKTNLAEAVNQKARRRRNTLSKKASEYCSECDADIHLVLRMKKSGKIFVLTSKSKDWPLSQNQLVSSSGLSISPQERY